MEFNNSWSMIYIAISIIVSALITLSVGCLLLRLNRKGKEKDSIFSINPEIGLFELPIFWMGITLPLSLFISAGIPLWSNYDFILSADAYAKFMEISKLPAIILATAIPISAAISRAHSTHQTAKQIRELINNRETEKIYNYKNEIEKKCAEIVKHSRENNDFKISLSQSFFKNTHIVNNYKTMPSLNIENISYFIDMIRHIKSLLLDIQNELYKDKETWNIDNLILNFGLVTEKLSDFVGRLLVVNNVPIFKHENEDKTINISILSTSNYLTIVNTSIYTLTYVIEESEAISTIGTEEAQKLIKKLNDSHIGLIVDFDSNSLYELIQTYIQQQT